MKSPSFKTPPEFFEQQRTEIWSASGHIQPPAAAPFQPPYAWAAAVAAVIVGSWLFTVLRPDGPCESFACLWDATDPATIELTQEEVDLWLEDDLLFDSMMNFDS